MPYISLKDIKTLDSYFSKLCSYIVLQTMTADEAEKEIHEYAEVALIFSDLYREQAKLNEKGKETMRKRRKENPEKEKAYAREYMKEYNAGKRRRKEKR